MLEAALQPQTDHRHTRTQTACLASNSQEVRSEFRSMGALRGKAARYPKLNHRDSTGIALFFGTRPEDTAGLMPIDMIPDRIQLALLDNLV
jgi:hypothetical protein